MERSQPFIVILERVLRRQAEAAPGSLLLACVSGGADSVALFHCLLELAHRMGFRLAVCHVHHGVRGEAADADAAFVQEMCERHGVAFHLKRLDFPQGAKVSENTLRQARYKAIRECIRETGARAAILAHHRDDLAETFLMRLIQGSGLRGLSGFSERAEHEGIILLRPMKNITKSAILKFLRERGISWREDRTNIDCSFLRNRIRHELIPFLQKGFAPDISETLARTAEQFSRLYAYITKEAENFLNKYVRMTGEGGCAVEYLALCEAAPLPDFLLSEALRLWSARISGATMPPGAEETEALVRLVREGRSGSLVRTGGGIIAYKDFEHIFMAGMEVPRRAPKSEILKKLAPSLIQVQNEKFHLPIFDTPETRIEVCRDAIPFHSESASIKISEGSEIRRSSNVGGNVCGFEGRKLAIPLDKITFPLILRTRRGGDEIIVGGMRKILKRWFVEKRIPPPLRDHAIIVQDQTGFLWAPEMDIPIIPPNENRNVLVIEFNNTER